MLGLATTGYTARALGVGEVGWGGVGRGWGVYEVLNKVVDSWADPDARRKTELVPAKVVPGR